MNVVVCIKQVPDTSQVKIDPVTKNLVREGVESIINPYDLYALEEGARIVEKHGGKVTVVTMGPPQAESALREAISLGGDEAILVSDRAFAGADTLATSYTLAMAVKKIKDYDLIICGKQAIDGDTAQVGPGIAAHLDIPQITYVRKIEELDEKSIVAERTTEEGYEVLKSPLPCLLTVVKEINEPRIVSLKGKMRAKKAEIIKWSAADLDAESDRLGITGSPTEVWKIYTPPARDKGEIFDGDSEGAVNAIVAALKDHLN